MSRTHDVVRQVYDWMPTKGPLPLAIQKLRGIASNKSVADPDVYITCKGTVRHAKVPRLDLTLFRRFELESG